MNNQYLISKNSVFYKRALKREIGIWSNKKSQNFIKDEFHPVKFKWKGQNIVLKKNEDWIWGDRDADLFPRKTHCFAPHFFAINAVGKASRQRVADSRRPGRPNISSVDVKYKPSLKCSPAAAGSDRNAS